jgi:GTPase
MREIIPFSIREFKKRIGKYNFVRKLKNPSRETIAQLIKNDEYMEDFNFSDVIVGYYKLPKELFYKNPYATYTEEDMRMYFDDIYFLCTKKNKNSKDIT